MYLGKFRDVRLVAFLVLVLSITLTPLAEEADSESTEDATSEVVWTYTPDLEILRDEWIEQGNPDIPTATLPAEVVKKFGFESSTIGPEIFYSNEVQEMMLELHLNKEWEPEPILLETTKEIAPFEGLLFRELLDIPEGPDGYEALQDSFSEFLGLGSKEELSEDALVLLQQLHLGIIAADEESIARDFHDYESNLFGLGEFSGTRTIPIPREHTEEQATTALNLLSEQQQEHLSEFTHILHDRPALLKSLKDMSKPQIESTLTLFAKIDSTRSNLKPPPIPDLSPEIAKKLMQDLDRGYTQQLNRKPPTLLFKQRVEGSMPKTEFDVLLGESVGQEAVPIESELGMAIVADLNPIPSGYLNSDSENYVHQSIRMTRRYYSHSVFGGSILIVEKELPVYSIHQSNLTIANHDALVIPFQYENDLWTTNVYAFNGTTSFRVYADGKLEGVELDRFVEFARHLVEYE